MTKYYENQNRSKTVCYKYATKSVTASKRIEETDVQNNNRNE